MTNQNDTHAHYSTLLQCLEYWKSHIIAGLGYAHNTHTYDDVVTMVMTGHAAIFQFLHDDKPGFMIVELTKYPQYSILNVFLAGGDLSAVLSGVPQIEGLAAKMGCSYLSMAGRNGWEKVLSNHGWARAHVAMYKPLPSVGANVPLQ